MRKSIIIGLVALVLSVICLVVVIFPYIAQLAHARKKRNSLL
jgi:hypothetical protein